MHNKADIMSAYPLLYEAILLATTKVGKYFYFSQAITFT